MLLPLLVGLAVPFVAAPPLALIRGRRLTGPVACYVRASPAMVPQGASAEITLLITGGAAGLPACGVESPEGRWTRLTALHAPSPVRPHAPEDASWAAPWPVGRLAPPRSELVGVAATGPHLPAQVVEQVPTGVRGVLGLPSLRLWAHDPFGLVAAAGPVFRPLTVVVYPPPIDRATAVPSRTSARGDDHLPTGRSSSSSGSDDPGELAGVRPYRAGDRLHLAHWPSIAGSGPILVREFTPDREEAVRVVLDDRPGAHRRHEFDVALGVAHSLVRQAVEGGRVCVVLTLSGAVVRVRPSVEGLAALFPVLATLDPRHGSRVTDDGPTADVVLHDAGGVPTMVVTTEAAVSSLPESVTAFGTVIVA